MKAKRSAVFIAQAGEARRTVRRTPDGHGGPA